MDLINFIEQKQSELNTNILDLTDENQLNFVNSFADEIYKMGESSEVLSEIEKIITKTKDKYTLSAHLALKIAKSKKILSEIKVPVHISVVFAVYKENTRILTKEEHPHGENFLLRKINQMNVLSADFKNISWDMYLVDDGCPEKSGKIAEEILNEKYHGNNVKVLYLQNAIDNKLTIAANLKSTDESRKGGSIEYGMWHAVNNTEKENHIVIFTDADLSTHLGQSGLLVDAIINKGKNAGIASRREKESVVIKKGTRNTRGKLFIYLWKRMLPRLNYIVDTQCGFKAFKSETLKNILDNLIEQKFAFDIELLLKTDLYKQKSTEKIPVAWIDSEAASTTTDLQPYLSMLKSITEMYKKYLPGNKISDEFYEFIKLLTEEDWNILVDNVPAEIAEKEPYMFDEYNKVSASDFKKILKP